MSIALIGALTLVGALAWRYSHRSRLHTEIAAALDDDDPQRRRAGVLVATEQGLRAHADLLAEHLDWEQDPDVLATLVEGVLRNSWEPADHPAILRLRLWAHEERSGALPIAPTLDDPRPATPHRRSRRAGGWRAAGATAGDTFVPSPRPASPSDGDGPQNPTVPGPMIPAPRRELGPSRRARLGPAISVLDRRARKAAARRAAALAAVTPAALSTPPASTPPADSLPDPIDDVLLNPSTPMPRPAPARSRRPQIDPPSLSPRRRGTRRDVLHRPTTALPSTATVELDHDDLRDDVLPRSRSRRQIGEPRHARRRDQLAAVAAAATEPEPAAVRRGARHRAQPGQLRFVRGDI